VFALSLALGARAAYGDCDRGCTTLSADYGLVVLHDVEPGPTPPAFGDLAVFAISVHGLLQVHRALYADIAWDVQLGSTLGRGGFAYDVSALPIGVGVRLAEDSAIGIAAGLGANGAVGTLDDAVTLPIELYADLAVHRRLRILARLRTSFVAAAPGRDLGAPSLPSSRLGDELDAMLAVRIRHRLTKSVERADAGPIVGVAYREWLGARFCGVVLGIGLTTE